MNEVFKEGSGQPDQGHSAPVRGPRVKVVCVGKAGTRMLRHLPLEAFPQVERAVVDTDAEALEYMEGIGETVKIGSGVTHGLGAGGALKLGYNAALESRAAIEQMVSGCRLIFLLAGMAGGTGGGASGQVALLAKEAGSMVFAFVIMPGALESGRVAGARRALDFLSQHCELLVPVYFDQLVRTSEGVYSAPEAFGRGNALLGCGIGALCTMLFREGTPKLDFATLRNVFSTRDNRTIFALGHGRGSDVVALSEAMEDMANSPLAQPRKGEASCSSVLVLFRSGADLAVAHVEAVLKQIAARFGAREEVVSSITVDKSLGDLVEICVFGTAGGERAEASASLARQGVGAPASAALATIGERAFPESVAPSSREMVQETISFDDDTGARYFRETPRLLEGTVDLDVPTYMRQGIKLAEPLH
ncbi:MAG: hypothetical protein LBD01_01980 [Puniceicoccales bacterium]|nr:hypothetical protein [Puniceicoccales bacterium]